MWINPMLTIFVWGVVFSLIVIVGCLWKWYLSEPPTDRRPLNTDGVGSAKDRGRES